MFDPKHRIVSAAPFRDLVVHHALHAVLGEIFERADSFTNPMPIARARARTARWDDMRSFGIDFVMCFAVTFIDISPRLITKF